MWSTSGRVATESSSRWCCSRDHARARWLSFHLPPNEANRLARVLRRTPCSVVPVFDLMEKVLKAAGMEVLGAEIGHWLDGLTPADFADHSDGTPA